MTATHRLSCSLAARPAPHRDFFPMPQSRNLMLNLRSCKLALLTTMALLSATLAMVDAEAQTTLRVVKHSDLKIVDPIWTTAYITRDHGYMIYDTLFATDADNQIKPQMVEKFDLSADKLTYTFTLRSGLLWHDGKPVTAEDCVASIKRWGAKDAIVDRVEWKVVADQQTAVNALIAGEIDFIEQPSHDLLPIVRNDGNIKLVDWNPLGNQYAFRFNTTAKPFDNVKIRQALL